MAQPTATFATNDMVGIREDLSGVIYNITPVETPFINLVARTEASNILHEWQTDALAAAANNAAIEGDDAPQTAGTATTRLNNRTQISTKDARVTGTSRSVNTAGRSDELDYQLLKRGRELRRDMETVLLSNKAKVTGSDVLARELAGVPSWIATNADIGTGGANPTGDGSNARTDGTQRAFTEDQLKDVLRQCFDAGGTPDVLMVGPFNRQIVSSFSAGRTNVQKAEDATLHATFEVYESDFGNLRIIPNRFQRARDALILQADMWAVAFLPGRNMATFDLAKTGDTDAKQILSEYTLEARQEASSGGVFDLTTS
jgi:hypothetical protein